MNSSDDSEFPQTSRRKSTSSSLVSVHVLSESVFCPRAGLIASESASEDLDGEPNLGPRLDPFIDYDERRLLEELKRAYSDLSLWAISLIPASLVVFAALMFKQLVLALVLIFPVCILLVKCNEAFQEIVLLVRERMRLRSAPEMQIDLAPTEVIHLSWWSLRKAGFDCVLVRDRLETLDGSLTGKPWRVLKKGNTIAAPVIRREFGRDDWGSQHEMRLAAYCDLIEQCENRSCPFGVILFAGTSVCAIIPNTQEMKRKKRHALEELNRLLTLRSLGSFQPPAPTDNRCVGCEFGRPREYRPENSETHSRGFALPACISETKHSDGSVRGQFHSDCGDFFRWVPPHQSAINLGIAQTRANANS